MGQCETEAFLSKFADIARAEIGAGQRLGAVATLAADFARQSQAINTLTFLYYSLGIFAQI